jgi:hypothetical protein
VKEVPWSFTARLFFVVKGILAIEIAGKSFSWTRENRPVWAADFQGRHDATDLGARIRGPASGCPAVVMVQPTHDWKSDHLLACLMSGQC